MPGPTYGEYAGDCAGRVKAPVSLRLPPRLYRAAFHAERPMVKVLGRLRGIANQGQVPQLRWPYGCDDEGRRSSCRNEGVVN